ncbi:uncharacterized protein [Dysidea avara]|uniref:uncharacterized protein isoform X2 n=1 Tax=Dysidea avara TaxID=196820 RepID=UPI0033284D3F
MLYDGNYLIYVVVYHFIAIAEPQTEGSILCQKRLNVSMKLTVIILCCYFALGITDDGIALGGAKPDQHFSDDFNKPFVPKVAKEMLTYNRRPIDSHDPCEKKQCSPGYSCKAVVNRYLLQVSVAICIPNSVANIVDNPPCISIVLGNEEMGCKTQEEWEKIGRIQCGFRVTSEAKYYYSTKLRNHCNSRYHNEHTFLQAEISCCPTEPTGAGSLPPTPIYEDDFPTDEVPDYIEDDYYITHNERRSGKPIIATVSVGFIVVGLAIFIVRCYAYRKHKSLDVKRRPVDGGMSFINPNSDVYDDVNFDDKKPLVTIPVKGSGEYTVVQNPVVTSE